MVIFIDTSAVYALLDANDKNHERAGVAWLHWLDQRDSFVSSSYVLLESISLLQRRLGMNAVRQFHEELMPVVQVQWITADLHAVAVSAFLAAGRRDLSLVDCTSFELIRRLGLRTVFAFDRHFAEQGFALSPT